MAGREFSKKLKAVKAVKAVNRETRKNDNKPEKDAESYLIFLFSEERQVISGPKSWTCSENGKDYIWYPNLDDVKSEGDKNKKIKKYIKTAVEPDQESGTWTKYEGSIMEDSAHSYNESEKYINKFTTILDSDFGDGMDTIIKDLQSVPSSQQIRDMLKHRIRVNKEQSTKTKTPRDKENLFLCNEAALQYQAAKTLGIKKKDDQLQRIGALAQQKRRNDGGLIPIEYLYIEEI